MIDGVVWFRKDVQIPADWAGKDLALSLGPIDDCDTTYFNGTQVGAIGLETPDYWAAPRALHRAGRLVKAGRAVIAVRVFDRWLNGGFAGVAADMTLAPKDGGRRTPLALAGPVGLQGRGQPPPADAADSRSRRHRLAPNNPGSPPASTTP